MFLAPLMPILCVILCSAHYFSSFISSFKCVWVLVSVCALVNWQTDFEYETLQSAVYYTASN